VRARSIAGGFALALCATGAQAAEGMPQLDFANKLTQAQIVWLALIFLVLYLLLSRWALPMVGGVLEMRAATIATDLEAARQSKAAADSAVAELTAATRSAQATAQSRIADAVATAKQAAAEQAATLNARLDTQIAQAEQRIGEARAAALGALGQVAGETAELVVARLTGGAVDRDTVARAVASTMATRRQAA
jgi:F-type H+-transporting ATPase subunit b